jgi:hypothetical protein
MIGVGIGIPFFKSFGGIDAQAQAHFNRVIADGGLIPSGLSGVNAFFTTVKTIYGTADITTAISVGLDAQVLGYKLGAGAGTTAGQAAQKLYSCSGASGDVVQTTAASQPLLLVHSGANYWWGSGISGSYCTTPNSLANTITGDIEIKAKINIPNFSGQKSIIVKSEGVGAAAGFAYNFFVNNGGLGFGYSTIGTTGTRITSVSSADLVSIGYSVNTDIFVSVSRNAVTGDIVFKYSFDGTTYTQLGGTVSSTPSLIFGLNSSVVVGNWSDIIFFFEGRIYSVSISNTIGGSSTQTFNPNSYNAATSQTQWTSSTGEIWSVQTGTATTGYKGVLVDRSITMFDGINDQLLSGTIATYQYITSNVSARTYNMVSSSTIITGSNDSHAIFNNGGTMSAYNQSVLSFGVGLLNNLRNLQANFNGGSSETFTNNILGNTGNTGAFTATQVRLGNNPVGPFTNCLINTAITTIAVMTNTQKNEMYDYIRSINNNAF